MVFKNDVSFKYKYRLMTTRVTNDTFYELQRYKMNNNCQNKCIINIPIKLRYTNVSISYPLIVLEMNNSINEFVGMGFILNITSGAYYSHDIYNNKNYNRHTYKSRFYVSLEKNHEDYIKFILPNKDYVSTLNKLQEVCFFGKGHLKRGSSLTAVPMKHLSKDINKHLMQIFLEKYNHETKFLLNLTTIKELSEETIKKILDL
tara:strand:+ start:5221 stop:5829 length:609 start_codon:yes stop_codon:yes gene_type:complete